MACFVPDCFIITAAAATTSQPPSSLSLVCLSPPFARFSLSPLASLRLPVCVSVYVCSSDSHLLSLSFAFFVLSTSADAAPRHPSSLLLPHTQRDARAKPVCACMTREAQRERALHPSSQCIRAIYRQHIRLSFPYTLSLSRSLVPCSSVWDATCICACDA